MAISITGRTDGGGIISTSGNLGVTGQPALLATDYLLASQTTGRNVIVNGGCEVSQVNGTTQATLVNASYPIDNCQAILTLTASGVVKATQQTVKAGNLTALRSLGATSAIQLAVTTAETSVPAGDFCAIRFPVEDLNLARFQWGTANAKAASLQFKVNASVSGTYSGSINFSGSTQGWYPFSYTVVGGVDTLITIPNVVGLTTAATMSSATAAQVVFNVGAGATYLGTANTWTTSNILGVTGQTNLFSTLNATITIADVQLEVGSFCTTYERKLYDQVLRECKRYKRVWTIQDNGITSFTGQAISATVAVGATTFSIEDMRIPPTSIAITETTSHLVPTLTNGTRTTTGSATTATVGNGTGGNIVVTATAAGGTLLVAGNASQITPSSATTPIIFTTIGSEI